MALGAFVWFGKRGSPTRRPLLPRNAGTAEPVRVSPPEAVAYPLELRLSFDARLLLGFPSVGSLHSFLEYSLPYSLLGNNSNMPPGGLCHCGQWPESLGDQ